MRDTCRTVVFLSLLFPNLLAYGQQVTRLNAAAAHPMIQQMVDAVSSDSLMKVIRGLQLFPSRIEFSAQRETAAEWLVKELRRSGVEVESDYYKTSLRSFEDVDFMGQAFLWAVGSQGIIVRGDILSRQWLRVSPDSLTTDLHGIDFVDGLNGWVVGNEGTVLHTIDGGGHWTRQDTGFVTTFFDVSAFNASRGIVVGAGGAIHLTTNSGGTWKTIPSGTTSMLLEVHTLAQSQAWAVGFNGTILRSTTGGQTWTKQQSGTLNNLTGVCFINANVGWAVGWGATALKTTNGGSSWNTVSIPPLLSKRMDFQDVQFVDSLTGWIVRPDSYLLETRNGGTTWREVRAVNRYDSPHLAKIAVLGRSLLVCSLNGELASSADAGVTWFRETSGLPDDVVHTTQNIRVTFPGSVSPERECVLLAHYDGLSNSPGADDNASGVSAIFEIVRILREQRFQSTITLLFVSAGEAMHSGSSDYAALLLERGRVVLGVFNADMIGYPSSADSTELGVGTYLTRNRLVDSLIVYNQRYAIGNTIIPYVDSVGISDHQSFSLAGFEAVNISEGTLLNMWRNNPYVGMPSDEIGIINPARLCRTTKLLLAAAAEIASPLVAPPAPLQWQSPFPQWNHLRASFRVDANTIVAAGDLGTIIKTTDRGRTWVRLVSETVTNLRSVWFTSLNNGFIAGDNGTMLRTTDGGATWTSQIINPGVRFHGLCFTDAKTGTAVGYPSAIYRTTNGGNTWNSQLSGPAAILQSISFTDAKTGIIVGSSGTILRTTNGGLKWYRMLTGFEESDTLLTALSFLDALRGIAVGLSGTILRTTDGGLTWSPRPSGTTNHLYALAYTDSSTVFASGDAGIILRSSDGGETWSILTVSITDFFAGLSCSAPGTVTAVGSFGTVFQTTDGGTSWTLLTQGPRVSLHGVWYNDPMTGTVIGYKGTILRTIDGGKTWTTQSSGGTEDLWGIAFSDPRTAVVVGQGGTLLRTTNAGTSWTRRRFSTSYWFSAVSFGSQSNGLVVGKIDLPTAPGDDKPYTAIARTTNGGATWTSVATDLQRWLTGVSFGTPDVAAAISTDGYVLQTRNCGLSWTDPRSPVAAVRLNGISSIGPNIITIVGDKGTILRTIDDGTSWTTQLSGTTERLNMVWFSDEAHGLVVGDSGTVLSTSNRGATWIKQASGVTSPLYAAFLLNPLTAVAVGERGTIVRTNSTENVTSVAEPPELPPQPGEFLLAQNYPNPFNASTAISFQLSAVSRVTLKVYDVLGREVAVLADGEFRAGTHRVIWDASQFTSGVYFYRLQMHTSAKGPAGDVIETKKMIFLK